MSSSSFANAFEDREPSTVDLIWRSSSNRWIPPMLSKVPPELRKKGFVPRDQTFQGESAAWQIMMMMMMKGDLMVILLLQLP